MSRNIQAPGGRQTEIPKIVTEYPTSLMKYNIEL
jgi:hypothetical protein